VQVFGAKNGEIFGQKITKMQFYVYFLGKILAHIKKKEYLCSRN